MAFGHRIARTGAIVALASVATLACHHAGPPTVAPVARAASADTSGVGRARADSIARATARRDSLARRARLDSIERANAGGRAAVEAARATLSAAIHFDLDHAEIRPDDRPLLDKKAALLVANPAIQLRVDGNADDRGSDEYNLALGMKRAVQVRQYLAEHGVDTARVATVSYGEEQPVCRQDEEPCWNRNRRDEFVIVAGGDNIKPVR